MKASRGFTLVELLIYAGLTAMIMGLFGAILVTILRVQGEQNSSSSVSSELSFLMNTIKRNIHESVSIELVNPSHIRLTKDTSPEPDIVTVIEYSGTVINLSEEGPTPLAPEQISSAGMKIDNLVFEKLQDATSPASVAVRITITASADTTDPTRQSTRTLQATASPFLQSQ